MTKQTHTTYNETQVNPHFRTQGQPTDTMNNPRNPNTLCLILATLGLIILLTS